MKLVVLVVALAHVVTCGNVGVRSSSLLSPAGVTYVDGTFHAGLTAGPVGYSTSIGAQPIYQSAAVAAAPAAVAAQPVFHSTVTAAPVAYAAAPRYAAVPTVQHVQGVADVPVTRIEAQPAVIQKTVDVARPAVKTQRYEVRRPAIQKQFYDIEERVVVRPAGSAVVELDEPLSRTQKGPSVIQPTGGAVAVSSPAVATVSAVQAAPAVAAVPAVSAVSPAPVAASLPSVEINLARSSLSASVAPVQTATYSGPAYASQSLGISQIPVKTVTVSTPIQSAQVSGISSISAGSSGISAVSPGTAGISFSTPAPQYQQQQIIQTSPRPELSDDSVSIDSADFTLARSSGFARQSPQSIEYSRLAPQSIEIARQAPQPIELARQAPQAIEYARQVPQSIELARQAPQPSSLSRQAYQSSGPQAFVGTAPVPTRATIFRSELPPRRFISQGSVSPRTSLLVNYPNAINVVPQPQLRSSPIYSERSLQSDINQENQQKLIQLLTARGGVSEVGFGRSGSGSYPVEAGEVRARVLSATPAPAYSAPAGERVNTRRVVVSRPIETLQEVEVAEPVTKYETVQVDQPTLIKTARQDVVRVPTSVPVYGKAFAPIAEDPISAISADWK